MSDSESDVPLADDGLVCDPDQYAKNKRRAENKQKQKSLPKVFWMYDMTMHLILGAALFTNCLPCANSDQRVSWELSRVCLLSEYKKITSDDRKYYSCVFELTGSAELGLRLAAAKVGGTINSHFTSFVARSWKCICFNSKPCGILIAANKDRLVYVETSSSVCGLLGLTASTEQSEEAQMENILCMAEDGDADNEAGQVPRL